MAAPEGKTRWYHLTPGRLIAALVAVECLLWLSDRLGWPHWHKGYAVLTGVAVVGAALLLMPVWYVAALLFRWRFQFSIRSLLFLTSVVALPFSWLAVEMKRATEQHEAVKYVEAEANGLAFYDWQYADTGQQGLASAPEWLQQALGTDFFSEVLSVDLGIGEAHDADEIDVKDDDLARIECLTDLRQLMLGRTLITDDGLRHVEAMTRLEQLFLGKTKVTDSGLWHLRRLKRLGKLNLAETKVTGIGLQDLERLPQLASVQLDWCPVTEAGLEQLTRLPCLTILGLGGTKISEAGLKSLAELRGLRELNVLFAEFPNGGVKRLYRALPNCEIQWPPPEPSEP